jgi:hypothetical protein
MPVLLLAGCIPNKGYRTQLTNCDPAKGPLPSTCAVQFVKSTSASQPVDIPLAFIEFDDMGQAFKRGQMDAAEAVIHEEQKKFGEKNVVTIVFIHGWKNNASDDTGNVPGFRRFLQEFQQKLGPVRLVGVYFAWRGGVTNAAVIKELTYWNRRDTATYIPGSNMSEALFRVARAVKGPDYKGDSKLVVVGHSFGGLVLERTVDQHLTRRFVENTGGSFYPFADLIIFVNEAAAATESIQLLTMLKDKAPNPPQRYPTIVSITSQGDLATKFILPVAQGASLFKKSLREYDPKVYDADVFGIPNQKSYYLRSAAHIPELQSHVVGNSADILAAYQRHGYTCASVVSAGGKRSNYYVVPIAGAKNDTPYWVMEMPVEIVPDHSNIFRVEFATLLQAFVLRQAQEDPEQRPDPNTCYSDPAVAPRINMQLMRSEIRVK